MTVNIPFCFLNQTARLSWTDIHYAISHDWISPKVALEFSAYRLASPLDDLRDEELEFVRTTTDWQIIDLVEALANHEKVDEDEVQRKWLYIILSWVYANRETLDEPLQMVEEIYADFNYPEAISTFVRYMPMTGPDLGNRPKCEERLYQYWLSYLVAEAVYWKRNMETESKFGGTHG